MSKTYDDINVAKYKELQDVSYKIAEELMLNGFSKEVIYTFLHKSIDLSMYRAECCVVLGNFDD